MLPPGVVIVDLDTGVMHLSTGELEPDPRWPPPEIPKSLRTELVAKLKEANVTPEERRGVDPECGRVVLQVPSPQTSPPSSPAPPISKFPGWT